MIPIIFAVSLITFPQVLASFFQNAKTEWIAKAAQYILNNFSRTGSLYAIILFICVFFFTFFYISITFNPDQIAENIQKHGGFIPGIRPGKPTAKYLASVSNRLTLFGGLFLGFIATFPFIINSFFSYVNVLLFFVAT